MTEAIYCGDNLRVLPKYIEPESVDLVYVDPPFNTGRTYEVFWGEEQERRAYDDRFGDPYLYLDWMAPRLEEFYRVLKPTGSFYIHCDPTASHYLKVVLDRIFGYNSFLSEVIWKRTSAHSSAKRYGPVHDVLLVYSKSKTYTWNTLFQPYDDEYLNAFYTHRDHDGRRWRRSDLTGAGIRHGETGLPWRGIDVTAKGRHWAVPPTQLDLLDAQGKIHWPAKPNGMPMLKRYADEQPGVPLQDVWTDIRPLHNLSDERLGYPTQKPVALLERILSTSSNPGDIVLDGFCGCGTTLEAAVRLKRRWIGIDFSPTACRVMARRLEMRCGLVERRDFRVVDLPRDRDELRRMPPFEFQNWAVNALGGIPNRVKVADYGIDGRLYLADQRKPLSEQRDLFGAIGGHWFPIQVKQKDKAGRPDIDLFETAMRRDKRTRGYFVSFDFTRDALQEIRRVEREGLEIVPIRVDDILKDEYQLYGEPPKEFSVERLRRLSLRPPDEAEAALQEAVASRRRGRGVG